MKEAPHYCYPQVLIFTNLHMHTILTQMIKTAQNHSIGKELKKKKNDGDHPPRKFSSHNVFKKKKNTRTGTLIKSFWQTWLLEQLTRTAETCLSSTTVIFFLL